MTLSDVVDLLTIAEKARQWPETQHLGGEAVKLLKSAKLDDLINVVPITIVGPVEFSQPKSTVTPATSTARRS